MNTVTQETIQEWKDQYGKVYKSTIGTVKLFWKKINRKEYVALMTTANDAETLYERQEAICRLAVLNKEDLEEVMIENGGLATTLSEEILYHSGFNVVTSEV